MMETTVKSLESLEEKINKVINQLHDVKAQGLVLTSESRMTIRQFTITASDVFEDVKDSLINTVDNQLSQRQIIVLLGDKSGNFIFSKLLII